MAATVSMAAAGSLSRFQSPGQIALERILGPSLDPGDDADAGHPQVLQGSEAETPGYDQLDLLLTHEHRQRAAVVLRRYDRFRCHYPAILQLSYQ
jgi:hypothetical protein